MSKNVRNQRKIENKDSFDVYFQTNKTISQKNNSKKLKNKLIDRLIEKSRLLMKRSLKLSLGNNRK